MCVKKVTFLRHSVAAPRFLRKFGAIIKNHVLFVTYLLRWACDNSISVALHDHTKAVVAAYVHVGL